MQCDMGFTKKGSLKGHMKMHSDEKKHLIDMYMWTHTREKPYQCNQCD